MHCTSHPVEAGHTVVVERCCWPCIVPATSCIKSPWRLSSSTRLLLRRSVVLDPLDHRDPDAATSPCAESSQRQCPGILFETDQIICLYT